MGLITTLIDKLSQNGYLSIPEGVSMQIAFGFIATSLVVLIAFQFLLPTSESQGTGSETSEPPVVPHVIPFLGNAIQYGIDPLQFLQECQSKYGDCFTFLMMGRKMTYCLGPDGNHFVFNVPLANASAEAAYDKLTVPVFGDQVVYDVDNAVFMEQKKFVKDALTTAAFKQYVPMIRAEAADFFKSFQKPLVFIFEEMSELTIRTAAQCLMGKEIRKQLHSNGNRFIYQFESF